MTDATVNSIEPKAVPNAAERLRRRRYAAERRFKVYGIASIAVAISALLLLLGSMALKGASAFLQTHMVLNVELPREDLAPGGKIDEQTLRDANYSAYLRKALRSLNRVPKRLGVDPKLVKVVDLFKGLVDGGVDGFLSGLL